jgi:hypothetical protein
VVALPPHQVVKEVRRALQNIQPIAKRHQKATSNIGIDYLTYPTARVSHLKSDVGGSMKRLAGNHGRDSDWI